MTSSTTANPTSTGATGMQGPVMAGARPHRRFVLQRTDDVSGVSGVGDVAEGCQFHAGVALQFNGELVSFYWYPSIEMVEAIHGHGGRTTVKWLDD